MRITKELTLSDRRRIREQLEREQAEGVSLDPAVKCKCICGNVHYRKREEANESIRKHENQSGASSGQE